jgi:hypothetical protein
MHIPSELPRRAVIAVFASWCLTAAGGATLAGGAD